MAPGRMLTIRCLAAALLGFLAGCNRGAPRAASPSISTKYEVQRTSSNWTVEVVANDQPARWLFDAASDYYDITPFIVNGDNRVRLLARLVPGVSSRPADFDGCELSLNRVSYPGGKRVSLGSVRAMPGDSRPIDKVVEFSASVPVRWSWQDADGLGAVTDQDKRAVMKVLQETASLLRARDFRGVREVSASWWTGSVRPDVCWYDVDPEKEIGDEIQYSRDVKSWTVTVADISTIDFRAGTKLLYLSVPHLADPDLVSMFPHPAPIIQAGPSPDTSPDGTDSVWGVYMPEAFFIKSHGSWHMLYWRWMSR